MAKAGESFKFRISLFDTDGALVAAPTLAVGDVAVIGSDGVTSNINTLPTPTSVVSGVLDVTLSAAEMAGSAGDRVTVVFEDQVDDEWGPVSVDIELTGQDVDDLATQASVDVVDGNVDAILVDTGTDIPAAIAALNDLSAAELLGTAVEGAYTFSEVLQLMAAVLFGKASGGGTTTVTFRNTGDSADRVTAVVDSDGNRSAVTLNV